jgi:anti-sigma B factor antagonist
MDWNIVDLEKNGLAKFTLAGRMDVEGALAVDPVFTRIAQEKLNVVVDLADVTFLASLGIRSLVMCCKTLASKGGNLVLLAPQPGVEKVLNTSGISTIIPVVSDMNAAEAILLR